MQLRSFFLKGSRIAAPGPDIENNEGRDLAVIAVGMLRNAFDFDGIEFWNGAEKVVRVRFDSWNREISVSV